MDRHVKWLRRRIVASIATQTAETFAVVAALSFALMQWRTDEGPLSSLFASVVIGQLVALARLGHAMRNNPLNYVFMRKYVDRPFSYRVTRFQSDEEAHPAAQKLPGFAPVATIRDSEANPEPIFDIYHDPSRLVAASISRASGAVALISSLEGGRILVTDARAIPPHERLVMSLAESDDIATVVSTHQRAIAGRNDVSELASSAHQVVLDSLTLEHDSYVALGPILSPFLDLEGSGRPSLRLNARITRAEMLALPTRVGPDLPALVTAADTPASPRVAPQPAAPVLTPHVPSPDVAPADIVGLNDVVAPEIVAPEILPAPPVAAAPVAVPEVAAAPVAVPEVAAAPVAVPEVAAPLVSAAHVDASGPASEAGADQRSARSTSETRDTFAPISDQPAVAQLPASASADRSFPAIARQFKPATLADSAAAPEPPQFSAIDAGAAELTNLGAAPVDISDPQVVLLEVAALESAKTANAPSPADIAPSAFVTVEPDDPALFNTGAPITAEVPAIVFTGASVDVHDEPVSGSVPLAPTTPSTVQTTITPIVASDPVVAVPVVASDPVVAVPAAVMPALIPIPEFPEPSFASPQLSPLPPASVLAPQPPTTLAEAVVPAPDTAASLTEGIYIPESLAPAPQQHNLAPPEHHEVPTLAAAISLADSGDRPRPSLSAALKARPAAGAPVPAKRSRRKAR